MLKLKAKLKRTKTAAVPTARSLTTTTTTAAPNPNPSAVAVPKAKTKPRPDAAQLTLNFLKETPPDLVLELLVPYLLDQLLKRASHLRQRRSEIEERQQELHRRQQDVGGLAAGQGSETHTQTKAEVVPASATPGPNQAHEEEV